MAQEEFDFTKLGATPIEPESTPEGFDFTSLGAVDVSQDTSVQEELTPWDNLKNYAINAGKSLQSSFLSAGGGIAGVSENLIDLDPKAFEDIENAIREEGMYKDTSTLPEVEGLFDASGSSKAIQAAANVRKEFKPTKGIVTAVKSGDPLMTLSSILGTGIDMARSVATGASTMGGAPLIEMLGSSYTDAASEKAKELGISVEELMESNQDDALVPLTIGLAGGLLERAGLKGMTKEMQKSFMGNAALKSALMAASREGITEWLQSGLESGNLAIAGKEEGLGKESKEFFKTGILDGLFSEKGMNALTGGALGAGMLSASSQAVGRGLNKLSKSPDVDTASELVDNIDRVSEDDLVKIVEEAKNKLPLTDEKQSETAEDALQPEDQKPKESFDIGEEIIFEDDRDSRFIDSEGRTTGSLPDYSFETSTEGESFKPGEKVSFSKKDADFNDIAVDESNDLSATNIDKKEADEISLIVNDKDIPISMSKDAKTLQSDIIKFGLTEKAKERSNKLQASYLVEKLKNFKTPSGNKTLDALEKRAAKTRTMIMNIKFISDLNKDIESTLDATISKRLERDKIKTDREVEDQHNVVQDYINENELVHENLIAIGVEGMLKSTTNESTIEDNIKKIRIAAQNKVDHYKKLKGVRFISLKRALKEQEIAEDLIDRHESGMEDVLGPKERGLKELMTGYIGSKKDNYQQTSELYWKRKFEEVDNYFPTNAIGGFDTKDRTMTQMQRDIEQGMAGQQGRDNEAKPKINAGYHSLDRISDIEGSGVFYDFNSANLFLNYVKNTTFETEAAPTINSIKSVLSDKKVRKKLGIKADILMDATRSYVNRERGVKKDGLISAADRLRSNLITTAMSTVGQLFKQAIPSVPQAFIMANMNPKTATEALYHLASLSPEWYKENAPGIYERGKSLERITLGDESKSVKGHKASLSGKLARLGDKAETISSFPIQVGDMLAAKNVFLAAFLRMGGDVNNVDPVIARKAELEQQTMQNVNTSSFAGEMFNSKSELNQLLNKTLFTYTNFALNQMHATILGAKNLSKAEGRRMIAGSAASAIGYQLVATAVRQIQKNVVGEEEDEEIFKEGDFTKALANGAIDLTVGPLPVVGDLVKQSIDEIRSDYAKSQGEEYDSKKEDYFFHFSDPGASATAQELLGPALGEGVLLASDFSENVKDAAITGDSEHLKLAGITLAQILNISSKSIPITKGDWNYYLKKLKKDIKAEIKKGSGGSSSGRSKGRGRSRSGNR